MIIDFLLLSSLFLLQGDSYDAFVLSRTPTTVRSLSSSSRVSFKKPGVRDESLSTPPPTNIVRLEDEFLSTLEQEDTDYEVNIPNSKIELQLELQEAQLRAHNALARATNAEQTLMTLEHELDEEEYDWKDMSLRLHDATSRATHAEKYLIELENKLQKQHIDDEQEQNRLQQLLSDSKRTIQLFQHDIKEQETQFQKMLKKKDDAMIKEIVLLCKISSLESKIKHLSSSLMKERSKHSYDVKKLTEANVNLQERINNIQVLAHKSLNDIDDKLQSTTKTLLGTEHVLQEEKVREKFLSDNLSTEQISHIHDIDIYEKNIADLQDEVLSLQETQNSITKLLLCAFQLIKKRISNIIIPHPFSRNKK